MRQIPHRTLVGTIREHVIAWRKATNLSREKVVQIIVEAHEQIGGATGIVFDPVTRDEDERKKVNAERVFRWLDDESKENNLLPSNFIHSILYAMPMDRRMACASEMLVSIGIGVRALDDHEESTLDINDIFDAQLTHTSALQAATRAYQNPTPENLEAADLQMTKAIEKTKRMSRLIAGAKKAVTGTKAFFHKVCHRKDKVTQ